MDHSFIHPAFSFFFLPSLGFNKFWMALSVELKANGKIKLRDLYSVVCSQHDGTQCRSRHRQPSREKTWRRSCPWEVFFMGETWDFILGTTHTRQTNTENIPYIATPTKNTYCTTHIYTEKTKKGRQAKKKKKNTDRTRHKEHVTPSRTCRTADTKVNRKTQNKYIRWRWFHNLFLKSLVSETLFWWEKLTYEPMSVFLFLISLSVCRHFN